MYQIWKKWQFNFPKTTPTLTLSLLITFANSLDLDQAAQSGSKMFETMMVILKEIFEKDDFEKKINRRQINIKIHSRLTIR